MAIDTQNKRRSTLGYLGPAVIVYPVPDGTVGTADRPHATWTYAGLTYPAPAVHSATYGLTFGTRPIGLTFPERSGT